MHVMQLRILNPITSKDLIKYKENSMDYDNKGQLYVLKFSTRCQPLFLQMESQEGRVLLIERHKQEGVALVLVEEGSFLDEALLHDLLKTRAIISAKKVVRVDNLYKDVETHRCGPLQAGCTDDESVFLHQLYRNGVIMQRAVFDDMVIFKSLLFTQHPGRYIGEGGWKANILKGLGIRVVRKCEMFPKHVSDTDLSRIVDATTVSKVIVNVDTGRKFLLPFPHKDVEVYSTTEMLSNS